MSTIATLHALLRGEDNEINKLKVREIISASPNLLWKANAIGWNALHHVAATGWQDEAWLLEKAVETDKKDLFISERTHNGGHSCISLFFRRHVDPLPWHDAQVKEAAAFLRDCLRRTTVDQRLLELCRSILSGSEVDQVQSQYESIESNEDDDAISRITEFSRQLNWWLRSASRTASQEIDESFSLLHALADVGGCPAQVAEFAVVLFPEQAATRDENGNLPLHLLCYSEPSSDENDCQALLHALLSSYPEAAHCTNRCGRLPLNIALSSGKGGAFTKILMYAEPRVLMGRDMFTRLPSFALAAAAPTLNNHLRALSTSNVGSLWHFLPPHAKQERLQQAQSEVDAVQLNTIYEIIQFMPDAVQFGLM
jgi:hypothetical protein